MSYLLTKKAEEDILRIFIDGAYAFGLVQAENYHSALESAFAMLAEFPLANREHIEFDPPIRIHPFQSHLIVYLVTSHGGLLIVRVLHKHEDWRSKPI